MTDNAAILDGYTDELRIYGGMYDLHVLVKPDADLDGQFIAFDCDEQEFIRVNGWLFVYEYL